MGWRCSPDYALVWAAEKGNAPLVKVLLESKLFNPSGSPGDSRTALHAGSFSGNGEVAKLLLADPRVSPRDIQFNCMSLATSNVELVKALLNDPRFDPPIELLARQCRVGNLKIVRLLLVDHRINPTKCKRNLFEIINSPYFEAIAETLLNDGRVNPSGPNGDQSPIRRASRLGSATIVKRLLADSRVDPSKGSPSALEEAIEGRHLGVVRLLLSDPRVDPSVNDQAVLRLVLSEETRNGNLTTELLLLLLADERVQPPVDLIKPLMTRVFSTRSIELVTLFLLHRPTRSPSCMMSFVDLDWCQGEHLSSTLKLVDDVEQQVQKQLEIHLLIPDLASICLEYVPDWLMLAPLFDCLVQSYNPAVKRLVQKALSVPRQKARA
jgi:ankyrin repeat protein